MGTAASGRHWYGELSKLSWLLLATLLELSDALFHPLNLCLELLEILL